MSDFLTRLVERQAGTVAMVQPRVASMFAPPASRTEPSDLPVSDSWLPQADASDTPPASIRRGHHSDELPAQPDHQEEPPPVPGPRPIPRAESGPRHAASSPAPLVKNVSTVAPQPNHETLASPLARAVTIPTPASSHEMEPTEQNINHRVGSSPLSPVARIEPPPRLVETEHAMTRSSAAAPPSLASGAVTGRKTPHINAAPPEPPVEVTIGRIEVTAVSTAPDTKRKPGTRRPAMSLEDYLTRRQGGRP